MRNKRTKLNIISSVTLQMVTIICGFIVQKLVIKSFGSSVNGLVASITRFLTYITLLEAGVGPVVKSILFKPIANKDKVTIEKILKTSEKFFRKIAYIFIIYILVLCVVMPIIVSKEFESVFTLSLVIIIAISTFSEYYFGITYKIYLQAEQKTYIISIIHIGTIILNTIMVVVLIKFGATIQVVKLVSAIIYVLRPILQNIYVKKKYNINLKDVEGNYPIKQKWDGLAQHIAYVVHKNTDIVILTFCANIAEVSVYSVYFTIINRLKSIVQSFVGGVDAAFGDMLAKGEHDILNRAYEKYEGLYLTIATILFSSTLFLIVPFVSIYTKGITDVDYIRPVFAYIMVFAEFICIIRQPYNDLVKVAGHFKQTKIGAWVEAISNIVISLILVWKYGIVGVAIGTLFAMTIRTIEFMYHCSKYILKRNIFYTFKRLLVIAIEVGIITLIVNIIPSIHISNYINWIIQACIVFCISSLVVLLVNIVFYYKNFKNIIKSRNYKSL